MNKTVTIKSSHKSVAITDFVAAENDIYLSFELLLENEDVTKNVLSIFGPSDEKLLDLSINFAQKNFTIFLSRNFVISRKFSIKLFDDGWHTVKVYFKVKEHLREIEFRIDSELILSQVINDDVFEDSVITKVELYL